MRLRVKLIESWYQYPGSLWRMMLRLRAWIEPVLVGEWARLIKDYAQTNGRPLAPGEVEARLVWQAPARDTSLARMAAARLEARGVPVRCVWSGARLTSDTLDIDHALPWSAWPCGDLWNLAPSLRRVNQHEKRDRLPSASALARAREPILAWWQAAWNADPALAPRFGMEARAALPIDGAVTRTPCSPAWSGGACACNRTSSRRNGRGWGCDNSNS